MLYLSTVTNEDGPFKIADLNPDNYEIIRRELIKKPYANDKILNKYMSSLSEKDFKPIVGKKGHLVLFDTNTPHVAGIPEIGRTRKTLRLDFICDAWAMPKNSIARRAVNKIFSLYN